MTHGNEFYACGIGENISEQEARNIARKEAFNEFTQICKKSSNCSGHKYTVTPLRTDCRRQGDDYKCYRGLKFTVFPEKHVTETLSLDDLDDEIKEREKELRKLRSRAKKHKYLEKLYSQIESYKENDSLTETKEVELLELKHHRQENYEALSLDDQKHKVWSAHFEWRLIPSLPKHTELAHGPLLSVERRFFQNMLGIRLSGGILFEDKDSLDKSTTNSGVANSTQINFGPYQSILLAVSLPFYFYKSLYIRPEYGMIESKAETQTTKYNNVGTTTGSGYGTTYSHNKNKDNFKYLGLGGALLSGKDGAINLEAGPVFFDKDDSNSAFVRIEFQWRF